MFTALVVTRVYLGQFVALGTTNPKAYTSLNFLKRRETAAKES